MLENLKIIELSVFNSNTLKILKPYFDVKLTTVCNDADREQWFINLLNLAQYNVGIAHCVQHNQIARFLVESFFVNQQLPKIYKLYDEQIAGHSGLKNTDTLRLENGRLSGTKHWISNLHQSEFVVTRAIDSKDTESYVLIDLTKTKHKIDLASETIGLEPACPSSLTLDNVEIEHVWDQQDFKKKSWSYHSKTLF